MRIDRGKSIFLLNGSNGLSWNLIVFCTECLKRSRDSGKVSDRFAGFVDVSSRADGEAAVDDVEGSEGIRLDDVNSRLYSRISAYDCATIRWAREQCERRRKLNEEPIRESES